MSLETAVLARHGESDYSVRELLNGDPAVACGLTPEGRVQARRLGLELARLELDCCVTSEFERTQATADEALEGRAIPRLVVRELNDPRYGRYEGGSLERYRVWAATASSAEPVPGGGESRQALVERYARAFATLLERPEGSILVVTHSLPIAFALAAAVGDPPQPRMGLVAYATPYRFERASLERVVGVLEGWLAAPDW